jgi:hypothetical protein
MLDPMLGRSCGSLELWVGVVQSIWVPAFWIDCAAWTSCQHSPFYLDVVGLSISTDQGNELDIFGFDTSGYSDDHGPLRSPSQLHPTPVGFRRAVQLFRSVALLEDQFKSPGHLADAEPAENSISRAEIEARHNVETHVRRRVGFGMTTGRTRTLLVRS